MATLNDAPENILDEAKRITAGSRNDDYGAPSEDMARTAKLWSAYKGTKFEARDVAAMMILLKLSRLAFRDKRDSWVDIAGYSFCGHECRGEGEGK